MLLCKTRIQVTRTILIKKQYLSANTWLLWLFGPLGVSQVKLKLFYIQLAVSSLRFINRRTKKLWLSKANAEITQFKNVLFGLHKGYHLKLKIIGVGYKIFKSALKLKALIIHLGYSHKIEYNYPYSVKFFLYKRSLKIWSCSKPQLSQIAFYLYALKKPDFYKGKGLIPKSLFLKLKPGKKSKT